MPTGCKSVGAGKLRLGLKGIRASRSKNEENAVIKL